MQRDVRDTLLYREVEAFYQAVRHPGLGLISDAAEVSTNGTVAVFTGTMVESLNGVPPTRICAADLATGSTRVLTFGPNFDRLPKYSPDGKQVAYLSDRHKSGNFQLYFVDPLGGDARCAPFVDGWVEYFHWSPSGTQLLLGVAGHGADVSGSQGAVTSKRLAEDVPSWMPSVATGDENYLWRRIWMYDLQTNRIHQVSPPDSNVWEAVWCGNDAFAAVTSPVPGEGAWYSARLQIIDVETGKSREIYMPNDQIGWPAASPSGKQLAIVEAICSDRWLVAGDLRVIDTDTGAVQRVGTRGVDITFTEWRSDRKLLLAGHRGFETVVGLYDANSGVFTEVWVGKDVTAGGPYVTVSGLKDTGDCVFVGESFVRAPEIALISHGKYLAVKSFDLGYGRQAEAIATVERVRWKASDGLEIQGWLLLPQGIGPHPLVMHVHGGPVWHSKPLWLGRRAAHIMILVKRGYAVFFPNPRGSTGRGQDFARQVLGDMGGADAYDCLSGLDHLIAQGIADPSRLGVTGASYGGFMTSWLVTQDSRFAAAVSVAPVTNQVSAHLISNIPHFVSLFLADDYKNPAGKYFQRSPIMHAHRVQTPTLNICGMLDRCTPPEEAIQFHNALLENRVKSALLIYPEEGHGIRKWPAAIDYAARVVAWFDENMPPL